MGLYSSWRIYPALDGIWLYSNTPSTYPGNNQDQHNWQSVHLLVQYTAWLNTGDCMTARTLFSEWLSTTDRFELCARLLTSPPLYVNLLGRGRQIACPSPNSLILILIWACSNQKRFWEQGTRRENDRQLMSYLYTAPSFWRLSFHSLWRLIRMYVIFLDNWTFTHMRDDNYVFYYIFWRDTSRSHHFSVWANVICKCSFPFYLPFYRSNPRLYI